MKKTLSLIAIAIAGMFAMNANAQTPENCAKCPQGQNAGDMNKMRQPREFTEFAFEGILLDINQQTRIDSLNAAVKAQRPAVCPEGKQQCDKAGKKCDKACDKQCEKACKDGNKCDKPCDKQCDKPCKDDKKCDKACDKKCDKARKDGKKCDKACDKKCDKACKDGKKCDKQGKECKESTQCDKGQQCDKGGHQCDKHGKGPHKMQPRRCANPYGEEYIAKVKEILTPEQYVVFLENITTMPQKMGAPQGQCPKGMQPKKCDGDKQCDKAKKCDKQAKMPKKAKK